MRYKVIVTEKAYSDIEKGMYWYLKQQKGLERKFLDKVKDCLLLLEKNPLAFSIVHLQIRKVTTKTYPYSLYYFIEDKIVTIFAVIYNSREETVWKNRIDKNIIEE